ncbi:hypothetical protein MTR_2g081370 [Medicago truncatula]|uniref:Uncharacterized protein n=1 Tax=Medicago truncatula TaxID=3880 RepID=G7IR85_MEDTR|nr:hypothetical protein MTR_2g081370 [Medicago truncatula]
MSLSSTEIGIPSPSVKLSTIEKDCRWENTRSTCEVNGVTVENLGRYTYLAHMSLPHVLVFATTIKHLSIKNLRMRSKVVSDSAMRRAKKGRPAITRIRTEMDVV